MSKATEEKNHTLAALCRELVLGAQQRGVVIRALGSMGFYLKLQKFDDLFSTFREPLGDIDLIIQSKDVLLLEELFTELGLAENKNFKRLFGYQRRIYYTSNGITVEVYLDDLYLCQKLPIRERIYLDDPTLCYTDLFLSKIQRIPLAHKDIFDTSLLLVDSIPATKDPEGLNLNLISKLCSTNWRWWKTITTNLGQLSELAKFPFVDQSLLASRILSIMDSISSKKKTIPWHFRNFCGDRVRWYESVE